MALKKRSSKGKSSDKKKDKKNSSSSSTLGMDQSQNIQVAVRVRPLNAKEKNIKTKDGNKKCIIEMIENKVIVDRGGKLPNKMFTFDHALWSSVHSDVHFVNQETVYNKLGVQILDNAFKGYNASLFAYGQTGSGKSYSTYGSQAEPGIIPRLCKELYERIEQQKTENKKFRVEVSMIELYQERARDLFNPNNPKNEGGLKVREHITKGPYVEGLSQSLVSSKDELMSLLHEGSKMRTIASTSMNDHSSRAHTIFQIHFTQEQIIKTASKEKKIEKQSIINLVDLAGSERQSKAMTSGERLKEGAAINLSLGALGKVIEALSSSKKQKFIPYRDSKLTWLLKESLGGNSKTIMIATISPSVFNLEETLSTLRYANRTKNIKNHAKINQDATSKIIASLRDEIARLKSQLGGQGAIHNIGDNSRFDELEAQLKESQQLIERYQKSESELKQEAEAYRQARAKVIKDAGLDIEERRSVPHLVNLSEDCTLSECLLYFFDEGTSTVIGSDKKIASIVLSGSSVLPKHALVHHKKKDVCELHPHGPVFINGKRLNGPHILKTSDRVMLGQHAFRFVNPSKPSKMNKVVDWAFAKDEFEQALEAEKREKHDALQKQMEAKRAHEEEMLRLEFENKRAEQNLEVEALAKQRSQLLEEIQAAKQAQLETLNNQESQMLQRHELEREIEEYQGQLQKELKFKKQLELDNADNENKARELQNMVALLRQQLKEEAEEKERIQIEHEQLQKQTHNFSSTLEKLQRSLQLAESEKSHQEALHSKLRQTMASQRKQCDDLNKQLAKLDAENHHMVMENTALQNDIRETKQRHQQMQKKYNNYMKSMDDELLPALQNMLLAEQKKNREMRKYFETELSVKSIECDTLKEEIKKYKRTVAEMEDSAKKREATVQPVASPPPSQAKQNELHYYKTQADSLSKEIQRLRLDNTNVRNRYAQLYAEYKRVFAKNDELLRRLNG